MSNLKNNLCQTCDEREATINLCDRDFIAALEDARLDERQKMKQEEQTLFVADMEEVEDKMSIPLGNAKNALDTSWEALKGHGSSTSTQPTPLGN